MKKLKVVVKKRDARNAQGYYSDNCLLHTAIRRKYPQAVIMSKGYVEVCGVRYWLDYDAVYNCYPDTNTLTMPVVSEKFTVRLKEWKDV